MTLALAWKLQSSVPRLRYERPISGPKLCPQTTQLLAAGEDPTGVRFERRELFVVDNLAQGVYGFRHPTTAFPATFARGLFY